MSVEGITQLLRAQGGVGSSRQVLAVGYSRRTVEGMVRRGQLVRVRRDALVLAEALAESTPWAKRALVARAVGLSLAPSMLPAAPEGGPAGPQGTAGAHALSHTSALMVLGLPYFGEDGLVHLVRTDGVRGRRDDTIWVHSPVDLGWVVDVDGIRVARPALAALQVAATHGVEPGLVALDGVLQEARERDIDEVGRPDGPATAEAYRLIASAARDAGPGVPAVKLVVELADGRSESAGESRSRWLLRLLGFGPCTPQFEVWDGPDLVGVADLRLDRWRVLVEFDGTGKYTGPESLLAEKDREDRIRALGYEVVRLRWADLSRPHLVRQRVLAAISRAQGRVAAG